MNSRHATNSDKPDATLNERQLAAIDLIVLGRNFQDVAYTIGADRTTISHWVNHNDAFIARLNLRRQELWHEMIDQLRGASGEAVRVLLESLKGPDRIAAAVHILKASGIYASTAAPTGPTTAQGVASARVEAEADAKTTRAAKRLGAALTAMASPREQEEDWARGA